MSHLSESEIQGLKNKAKNLRIDIIKMITKANSGHTGGSLSVIDLLTLLFFKEMKVNPAQPQDKERDRFVLSKGHAAPALYAVLADKGYFPKEELSHLRQAGHILQGHPDMKHIPGVDMTTGSLGQGISAACGMALCAKIDKASWRVYAVLGDGELEEGQVWEAAMYAHQYKLNNLIGIVDWNKKQIDGTIDECISLLDIAEKFRAFGWYAVTVKGDDIEAIQEAFKQVRENQSDKPGVLVLDGVKGSGVKCIEKMKFNHMIPVDKELADRCLAELEAVKNSL